MNPSRADHRGTGGILTAARIQVRGLSPGQQQWRQHVMEAGERVLVAVPDPLHEHGQRCGSGMGVELLPAVIVPSPWTFRFCLRLVLPRAGPEPQCRCTGR